MKAVNRPITVTTTLSLALHVSIIFGIVQTQHLVQTTGKGIHIELVSSSYISDQQRTERPANQAIAASATVDQPQQDEKRNAPSISQPTRDRVTPARAETAIANAAPIPQQSIEQDTGENLLDLSTNAATHSRYIIDLLHSSISEHKRYPYIARRQRREGVARVEFVLHPDGSINETRLVHSSKTRILDKAALEAVEGIAPFEPAKDYLHQPEAFQVDVVFNMI
jgi:TonB family protein